METGGEGGGVFGPSEKEIKGETRSKPQLSKLRDVPAGKTFLIPSSVRDYAGDWNVYIYIYMYLRNPCLPRVRQGSRSLLEFSSVSLSFHALLTCVYTCPLPFFLILSRFERRIIEREREKENGKRGKEESLSSCALVFGICPWTDASCPFSSPAAEPPFIGGHPLGARLSRHPGRQLQGASIYAHCWLACGFMRVRCIMRPVVHRVKPVCLVPSSRPGTQHVYAFWTSVERSVSPRLNGGLSIEIIEL